MRLKKNRHFKPKNIIVKILLGTLLLSCNFPPFVLARPSFIKTEDSAVVRESSPRTTTSTSFIDLPGAKIKINKFNPKGHFTIRFSGISGCSKGKNTDEFSKSGAKGACLIRILVNGQDVQPTDYRFDSTETVNQVLDRSIHSVSIDRSILQTQADNVISVQWAVEKFPDSDANPIYFLLDDWSLNVESRPT